MNRYLVNEYISKINKDDIVNYCKKNDITISNDDLNVIYYYIKNESNSFFDNPATTINELKFKLSSNSYNILLDLYNKYKFIIDKL